LSKKITSKSNTSSKDKIIENFSCTNCGVYNCQSRTKEFPQFCPTLKEIDGHTIEKDIHEIKEYLNGECSDAVVARASAEVEGIFYGTKTRVEEIIEFARRINAKKIGIATCMGLIEESKIFAKILEANHLEYYSAVCKVGAIDKADVGILEEHKINSGKYEPTCNPLLQARILNSQNTDLNVVVGLCVGHDSLFTKYSNALSTTLVTKDRLTGHNPIAALHLTHSYYKKLLVESKK